MGIPRLIPQPPVLLFSCPALPATNLGGAGYGRLSFTHQRTVLLRGDEVAASLQLDLAALGVPRHLRQTFLLCVPPPAVPFSHLYEPCRLGLTPTSVQSFYPSGWTSAFVSHDFVLFRFLSQAACAAASTVELNPPASAQTSVRIIFRGITAEEASRWQWNAARARGRKDLRDDWRAVVGVPQAYEQSNQLRVIELSAVEIM